MLLRHNQQFLIKQYIQFFVFTSDKTIYNYYNSAKGVMFSIDMFYYTLRQCLQFLNAYRLIILIDSD